MSEWDEYAEGWDQNKDARIYSELAFASLKEHVPKSKYSEMRVLDFGAGTGLLTEKLAPLVKHVLATDTSEKMIKVLAEKRLANVSTYTKELTQERALTDTVFTKKFDLIVASSVCSFLPDFPKTLGVMKELLNPSGYFVQWDWEKVESTQQFSFSGTEIKEAHQAAGLKTLHVGTAFSVSGPKGKAPVLIGVAQLS